MRGRYDPSFHSGPLDIDLPGGGRCPGRYRAKEKEKPELWGRIFERGQLEMRNPVLTERQRYGYAKAACPDGHVFECEFVASTLGGEGFCIDSRGRWFRLLLD